jgi:branched-chain amino acid transport system ATP-binding protein
LTAVPTLAVADLTLRFGGITALDGVTFEVYPGEVLGVIGPNGAGKTALLNCISGTYRPQGGHIRFDGNEVLGVRPHRIAAIGVARTFQSTDHFNDLTVLDYVLLARSSRMSQASICAGLAWRSTDRREHRERQEVIRLLTKAGLAHVRDRTMRELPYGLQRRVDLLRIEATEARLVLLDEPTSGTMSEERAEISDAVRGLVHPDTSVLIVDHDVDFVLSHCDRVVAMRAGLVLAVGPARQVLAHPDVERAFLGFVL